MSSLVKNNEINISERKWKKLNRKYDKETIKLKISDAISTNNIKLPYADLTYKQAKDAHFDLLELDFRDNIKNTKWFTRYDYNEKYYLKDKIFKCSTIGNKASNYFHQEARWLCDSINSPSPHRTWESEKFRLTLLNALWTLKVKKINTSTLRSCIGLRKYIASQFRPSSAKSIIEYFKADSVLDFSAGWGDRLQGFLASNATTYLGIDPNENLIKPYEKQLKYFNKNKDINILIGCAEDVKILGMYDLIFTSPPYFNIERYTQEDTQSFKRYRKVEDWLEKFLFKAIKKSWKHLNVGGHLAINISDVYSNHTINKLCDPMNDFISTLKGSKYKGCYGYEMRKRPNSGALKGKEGSFCEPLWVWKKTK